MGDLIDRREAIEAIGEVHPLDYNGQAILARIKALPAQTEVVRCEKCAIRYTSCPMVVRSGVVGVDKLYTEDDDYCSYGVAKGESDERYDKQTGGD